MTSKPQPSQPQVNQARAKIEAMKRQFEQKRNIASALSRITHKIGVYSGKGGVGKTTVAVNLAVTLAHDGATVGREVACAPRVRNPRWRPPAARGSV